MLCTHTKKEKKERSISLDLGQLEDIDKILLVTSCKAGTPFSFIRINTKQSKLRACRDVSKQQWMNGHWSYKHVVLALQVSLN